MFLVISGLWQCWIKWYIFLGCLVLNCNDLWCWPMRSVAGQREAETSFSAFCWLWAKLPSAGGITASWSRCHNTNPPWSPQCQWWYNSQTLEQRASHLEGKLGQSSGWWWGFRWSVAWAGGIPGGGVERTDVWEEQTDALPAHGGSPPKPTQALENFKLG